MARSFALRLITKNKPQEKYVLPSQFALPGNNGGLETNYHISQLDFVEGIDRYTAYHEIEVKKSGKANGSFFNSYYEQHNFTFLHDTKRSIINLRTNKVVASSFVNALSLDKDWPKIPINYAAMTPILPAITGAWFCELKQQYVRSAGYFGQHVDKSDEFKKAAECGQISVLYVNVAWPTGGPEYRVGITSEGSIIMSKHLDLEEKEIELVSYVFDTFISPTLGDGTK